MSRIGWAVVALIGVAIIGGAFVLLITLLRDPPSAPASSLARPAPGEVRADYLADGTPVWVVGLNDSQVGVISAFDTHRPANLRKLLWWCQTAEAFEEPAHGSRYDPLGRKIGGPAPAGLAAYDVEAVGSQLVVGALGPAPPIGAGNADPSGPTTPCSLPEDAGEVLFHTFEGWPIHESPSDAVGSAPDGWILLVGELVEDGGDVLLCAIGDCSDSVLAVGILPDDLPPQFSPLGDRRFIARVRDGELIDLTRVIPTQ